MDACNVTVVLMTKSSRAKHELKDDFYIAVWKWNWWCSSVYKPPRHASSISTWLRHHHSNQSSWQWSSHCHNLENKKQNKKKLDSRVLCNARGASWLVTRYYILIRALELTFQAQPRWDLWSRVRCWFFLCYIWFYRSMSLQNFSTVRLVFTTLGLRMLFWLILLK